jgi:hypothetical protein
MATDVRAHRLFLRPGGKAFALRKDRKRRVFGPRQVLLFVVLQAAFFLALREAYVFLITWDQLAIRRVDVVCAKADLKRALDAHFAAPRLGNILLCDLDALRARVRGLAWVEDASVQKVFPSRLVITVEVRTPFLVLERGGSLWLADAEGHVLEPVASPEEYGLPVVSDEGGFAADFYGKWEAAGRCFRSLPGDEAGRLAAIRCGDFGTLELAFKGDPVRIVVGAASPAADLARFRARRAEWEGLFGPLALVHMGFDGRVYVRTAEPAGDDVPPPDKGD